MTETAPLLPEATFEQLFDELVKRFDCVVLAALSNSDREILRVSYSGGRYLALGVLAGVEAEITCDIVDEECVDPEDLP